MCVCVCVCRGVYDRAHNGRPARRHYVEILVNKVASDILLLRILLDVPMYD